MRLSKKINVLQNLSPLPQSFYLSHATELAPKLLGKVLFIAQNHLITAARIIEVEAYLGKEDPASHAYRGKTARNQSMFLAGGSSYVYLCYGMHHCLNVVTGPAGLGEAILLRALVPLIGEEIMQKRRMTKKNLTNGPGNLTKAMGITKKHDGRNFFCADFKIVDSGFSVNQNDIIETPRIGISKGKDLLLRFCLKNAASIGKSGESGF